MPLPTPTETADMDLAENTIINAEAQKRKASRVRRANEIGAEAEQLKAMTLSQLERRAPELTTWREQTVAHHQQVFDAAVKDVEQQFAAGMASRFPGEIAEIHAEYDDTMEWVRQETDEAAAEYQSVRTQMALTRAVEPITALRVYRARRLILQPTGSPRSATLAAWEDNDYASKLHKKLRRALKLEAGAALPPEVEAALVPTPQDIESLQEWANTPVKGSTGDTPLEHAAWEARYSQPAQLPPAYIPDPATMPVIDPELSARLDAMLGDS